MEPAPVSLPRKAVLSALIVALLVAPTGCGPTADAPAEPSAAERAPVGREELEQAPSRGVAGETPGEEAVAVREAQKRKALTALESSEPLEAHREDLDQQLPRPVAVTEPPPEAGKGEVADTETEQPTGAAAPLQDNPFVEEEAQGEPPLPPPLVDDPQNLQRLHPSYPVWIDRDRKHVILVGRICQRRAPLELFACIRHSKEHESVVAVDTQAYVVHAGLLATGAESGSPVQFVPEFVPPTGTEIEVTVVWEDASGRRRQARGQDWVRNVAGLYDAFEGVAANEFDDELNLLDQPDAYRDMPYPWVFAGSRFLVDEETGEQSYLADGEGDLICVSNFPSAVLDVPIRSSDSNAALLFEAFTERIPPIGTPVTLILTPKIEKKPEEPGQKVRPAD